MYRWYNSADNMSMSIWGQEMRNRGSGFPYWCYLENKEGEDGDGRRVSCKSAKVKNNIKEDYDN